MKTSQCADNKRINCTLFQNAPLSQRNEKQNQKLVFLQKYIIFSVRTMHSGEDVSLTQKAVNDEYFSYKAQQEIQSADLLYAHSLLQVHLLQKPSFDQEFELCVV